MEKIFHDIYVCNSWGEAESVSGPVSSLARTSAFRAELPPLYFPPPLRLIDEKRQAPDGLYTEKCLALWRLEDTAV